MQLPPLPLAPCITVTIIVHSGQRIKANFLLPQSEKRFMTCLAFLSLSQIKHRTWHTGVHFKFFQCTNIQCTPVAQQSVTNSVKQPQLGHKMLEHEIRRGTTLSEKESEHGTPSAEIVPQRTKCTPSYGRFKIVRKETVHRRRWGQYAKGKGFAALFLFGLSHEVGRAVPACCYGKQS